MKIFSLLISFSCRISNPNVKRFFDFWGKGKGEAKNARENGIIFGLFFFQSRKSPLRCLFLLTFPFSVFENPFVLLFPEYFYLFKWALNKNRFTILVLSSVELSDALFTISWKRFPPENFLFLIPAPLPHSTIFYSHFIPVQKYRFWWICRFRLILKVTSIFV